MYGIFVLIIYAILMAGTTLLFTKKTDGAAESFHVSDRKMGTVQSALSIAATWIWAPSLFVSAERAYLNGVPGLFWFLVPNVLCLIIFIPFAKRIRDQMPQGITLSAYMGEKYQSGKVRAVYQFELSALAVLSTGVQLLAGAKILEVMTGLPFWAMTVALAVIAYSYSQFSGIKASVLTDAVQMVIIFVVGIVFVGFTLSKGNGIADLIQGLGSATGAYGSLFDAKGIEVLFAFGLPTAIGLISGPFGDQSFWQRAFAVKKNRIGRAFAIGAAVFAVVPLSMGIIGYVAAGSGFTPNDTGMVNFEYLMNFLPQWTAAPFLFMIISGLLSTVDSNLCAAASLTTDLKGKKNLSKPAMLALLALGVGIANIPGLTVTHLFLIYGTLRASTLLPTVMTLLGKKLSARGIVAGVLTALCAGLPIFAYGTLFNLSTYKTLGSLFTVLSAGIVAALVTRKEAQRHVG